MELTVKIIQHTPIIHFQWDQTGATLRATELKPKLDKFLKEKNDPSIEKYFGQKGNLPYKVRIELGECTEEVYDIEETTGTGKVRLFPTFFGNIKAEKVKKFVFYDGVTTIRFLSFNKKVLDTISEHIAEFFFKTNFGTRQSKGFGSFYIDPSDSCYKSPSKFENYHFTLDTWETNPHEKYKKLFGSIDLFYKTLRSGINIKDREGNTLFYFKSIMFLYAKNKGWTWDKKAIKSKFVDPKTLDYQKKEYNNSDILTFSGNNEYLVRDLLGVAPSQVYKYYNFSLQYDEKNEIERFKSPITFKVIHLGDIDRTTSTVYIILNSIPEGIFYKKFKINKVIEKNILDTLTLTTPPLTERFNIEDYFNFVLNIDIYKHVDEESRKNWRFRIIKNIYSQLRTQLTQRRDE